MRINSRIGANRKDKGISKEVLIDAIEAALITAYKRNYGSANNVEVYIDRLTGDVRVFALRILWMKLKTRLLSFLWNNQEI